jgi:hypothetical protein
MANFDRYIDWAGCELVERIPGKVSGRPVVRGARILADTIVLTCLSWQSSSSFRFPLAPRTARAVRVLLDHNLPHELRTSPDALSKHEPLTASYTGWRGLKNGELLRIARGGSRL